MSAPAPPWAQPVPGSAPGGAARPRWARPWVAIVASVVVLTLIGGAYALHLTAAGASPPSSGSSRHGPGKPAEGPDPLLVVSTDPAPGSTGVASDATIAIDFSTPVSLSAVTPTFTPAVPGTWQAVTATTIEFLPSAPFVPGTAETLTIPGGLTAKNGSTLGTPETVGFTIAAGDTLRLQQLLAQLNYLPLSFTPAAPPPPVTETATDQPGTFTWRWTTLPSSLTSLWTPGQGNVITRGAIMAFEEASGLDPDGDPGPKVWSALLTAAAGNSSTTATYNYVVVSKSKPENLTVYQDGSPVLSNILVNTGVEAAPTVDGTFPVYQRFRVTTMSGTNPDGSHYKDPGIPWVSYFNGGDALHGFIRAGYGYPQSDGCVEMTDADAEQVYPLTPIGTLVTVAG
jgi:lipoprotein-anchoring transpeptidase ErfK/SrfK